MRGFDPRVKPERGTYDVDYSHPCLRGVLAYFLFSEGGRVVRDETGRHVGALQRQNAGFEPLGRVQNAIRFDDSQNQTVFGATKFPNTAGGDAVFIAAKVLQFTQSSSRAVFYKGQNGVSFGYVMKLNGGVLTFGNSSGDAGMGRSVLAGSWNSLAIVSHDATHTTGYVNGVTGGVATTGCSSDTTNYWTIGNRSNTAEPFNGLIEYVLVCKSAPATDAIVSLAAEPYAMLRPIRRRVYSIPSGGTVTLFRRSLTNRTGSRSAA